MTFASQDMKTIEDFIQVKHYHSANYIYYPESEITIEGRKRSCPDKPILVPTSTTFKINELEYTADRMYVEQNLIQS